MCVNLQRLHVWPLEPSWLPGLALHLQQNPAVSLFLMRAGGMYQAFSCFLFSLSLPPRLQSGNVKHLTLTLSSSSPSISSCSPLIYSGATLATRPGHINCQTISLSRLVQRESNEQFFLQSFTCANQPDALSVETYCSLQAHSLIQFHEP